MALFEHAFRFCRKVTSPIIRGGVRVSEYIRIGSHKHKCSNCRFVWEHSNRMGGVDKAHRCPCGDEQYYKYAGNEKPQFRGDMKPYKRKARNAAQ